MGAFIYTPIENMCQNCC